MDPLSLVTACALVFQSGPEGLYCQAKPSPNALTKSLDQSVIGNRKPLIGAARWKDEIAQASARFAIPQAWIASVMAAESGGNTELQGRPSTSSAGAVGLMQVMPETYETLRQRYGLGADPFDPTNSIQAGTAYLREMYERYGYPNLFGAYNAGPGRFDAYLLKGVPLPQETQTYMRKIVPGSAPEVRRATRSAPAEHHGMGAGSVSKSQNQALFFVRSGANSVEISAQMTGETPARNTPSEADLFVPLRTNLHSPQN